MAGEDEKTARDRPGGNLRRGFAAPGRRPSGASSGSGTPHAERGYTWQSRMHEVGGSAKKEVARSCRARFIAYSMAKFCDQVPVRREGAQTPWDTSLERPLTR
jgi:hypothetical protein